MSSWEQVKCRIAHRDLQFDVTQAKLAPFVGTGLPLVKTTSQTKDCVNDGKEEDPVF